MACLSTIEHALATFSPELVSPTSTSRRAAVALILDGASATPHILYIRRAEHPNDPWSGHLAFPGGRFETIDSGINATAIRETHEEVGIDLTTHSLARPLGRLNDVQGRARGAAIDMIISCFVYVVNERPMVTIDTTEVDAHFWVSVNDLIAPVRQVAYHSPNHSKTPYPGVQITSEPSPVLWGLTYRFTRDLLAIADVDLPAEAV